MKKIIVIIMTLLICIPSIVFAKTTEVVDTNNRIVVTLENCSTVSNIWVKVNGKTKRIGLLAYDTDNTSINTEINNYVSQQLKNANLIEIEYDINNNEKDDYNRELVWIYVNGELLQEKLISLGYGKVNFVNGEYSYLENLCSSEQKAIDGNKGIWKLGAEEVFCSNNYNNKESELEAKLVNNDKFEQSILYKLIFISILLLGLLIMLKGKRINEKRK